MSRFLFLLQDSVASYIECARHDAWYTLRQFPFSLALVVPMAMRKHGKGSYSSFRGGSGRHPTSSSVLNRLSRELQV